MRAINSENSPKLVVLVSKFGYENIQSWISLQLEIAFQSCGFQIVGDTSLVTNSIFRTILSRYAYYKLSEIALFCAKFKTGGYGTYPTLFNQQKFMDALFRFNYYRIDMLEKAYWQERNQERDSWKKTSVPCPDNMELDRILKMSKYK